MRDTYTQSLIERFNKAYHVACLSSKPDDWLNAALAGRHLVNGLVGLHGYVDTLGDLQKETNEQEKS